MHHYMIPINGTVHLIKTDSLIPEGTEYSFEGESLICVHATFKSGTYGFLIPKGNQLNREHAFWHVIGIHPNPLEMDKP